MCSFADSGVEGVKHILNCISSTSHSIDALGNMLVTVSNFASESIECAELVVKNRALEFLQPIVVHDDPGIALSASSGICTLAAEKKFFEVVDRSDALPCVQDVLRSITPGSLHATSQWSASDLQSLTNKMNSDSHPAVQLCALHEIGESFMQKENQELFSTVNMLNLFKALASSPDPFVYAAAVYLLRVIHMPVPHYRATKVEGNGDKNKIPVSEWTVEMVCQWVGCKCVFMIVSQGSIVLLQVGSKPFRIYRHMFRDGFVNGQMLLSINKDILEENKITNVWHQQSILFAVGKLREASENLSNGRLDTLGEVFSHSILLLH
jgi:hypothetical protein